MAYITRTLDGLFSAGILMLIGAPLALLGAAAAYLSGLRDRFLIVAISAPTAIGLLIVTSQVLGAVGLGVPLPILAVLTLVPAALTAAVQRLLVNLRPTAWTAAPAEAVVPARWPVWAGATLGAAMSLAAWLPGINDPSLPGQNIDDVWHGYLTARIGDMHVITAGTMSPVFVDQADPRTFYPYGVHLAGATVDAITGAGVPQALNSLWPLIAGVLLAFGVAAVLRALLPDRPWVAAYGAIAASGLQFFPYVLTGIQPYAIALAMIPALLALVVYRARSGPYEPHFGFLLVVSALAVLVTHPAAATAAAVVGAFVVLEVVIRGGTRESLVSAAVRLAPVAVVAYVLARPFLRSAGGTLGGQGLSPEIPYATAMQAAKQMLAFKTPFTPSGQPFLALVVLCGVAAVVWFRGRGWSLAAGYLVFAFFYANVASGVPWARGLSHAWYGEWHRLAGIVVMLAAPLAGLAAGAVHAAVARLPLGTAPESGVLRGRASIWRVALVSVLALVSLRYVVHGVLSAQSTLIGAWTPKLATADDKVLYRHVADRVTDDQLVLNAWYDGSTWMYAMAGARPAMPYQFSGTRWNDVYKGLPALTPAHCRILRDDKVAYLVGRVDKTGANPNPVLDGAAANSAAFTLEFENAAGKAYQVNQEFVARCAQ
ncbi:MAG: DUF6541 family protein [Mycobacteriales bacterium]